MKTTVMFSYIKKRRQLGVVFLGFTGIFALVFYLYSLPLDTFLYAIILCFSFSMPLLIYDVYQYYSRHKRLLSLMNSITVNMEELPKASDLIEQDYQTLLTLLFEDKAEITSKADVSK